MSQRLHYMYVYQGVPLNGEIYSYLKIRDKIILFEFFHPYKGTTLPHYEMSYD